MYLAAYLLTLTYAKTSDAGTDLTIIRMCLLKCMPFVFLNAVDRLHYVGTGAGCECCKLLVTLSSALLTNANAYQQLRASFVSVNLFSLLCDGSSPVTASSLGDISRYGGPILYLFLYAFVLFGILVWVDSGSIIVRKFSQFRKKPIFGSGSGTTTPLGEKTDVKDVDDEAAKVLASDDALRVMNVVKAFDSATNRVVDDVSFGVSQDTIFALLGPNGAGKTTTFNVIRAYLPLLYPYSHTFTVYTGGDVIPDEGDVLIKGVSMVHHPRSARLSLGVCPQFTAIDSQLTVREHLLIYGRLKGLYRGEELKTNVESLMRATSLHMYADRLASKLSGGNQRKLSLAIALIGAFACLRCGGGMKACYLRSMHA